MFYIDYDLVRRLTEDRRARAMARFLQREAESPAGPTRGEEAAEVIELTFGPQCEPEQIGA